ncbi:ribosomal RNA small subunit methyltransferase H [Fulvitalea axinellae]|uniref:Ribosomal RNA small subunit methyltransferase H n=1 Tax=Fulvitalea axinellae TaxID=1182444 RepID=A0AAU9CIB0_9BACT|nr:ribosomal RNA small subunit methyltransferase H [Fulvitalea axinellae]
MTYHVPVMLKESVDAMNIKPDGTYVDVTFGGGGHTREILSRLGENGRLFSFDQDEDARANAEGIDHPGFTLVESNFRYLARYLKLHGVRQIDALLGDFGVSSHQFDVPERGFSTRFDAALDMRMGLRVAKTAADVVNDYSEKELHRILGMYGELKNAKTVAAAIVSARMSEPIETVNGLKEAIGKFAPRGKENKFFAQVFQGLRIEVNDEMGALEDMLTQCSQVIKPGGRLVAMSYHSLEDRLVKNFIAKGKFYGQVEKDFYGNMLRPFEPVTRKPIVATTEEVEANSRARSAKLRVAERTDLA